MVGFNGTRDASIARAQTELGERLIGPLYSMFRRTMLIGIPANGNCAVLWTRAKFRG